MARGQWLIRGTTSSRVHGRPGSDTILAVTRLLAALAAAALAIALTACSSITAESLESATEAGGAPTVTRIVPRAMSVEIEWEQDTSSKGWQLEYSFDEGQTWLDSPHDMLDDDGSLYTGADVTWMTEDGPPAGGLYVRVRKVIDANTVSPWATEGPIATSNSLSAACVTAFQRASKEAHEGSGERELERTLDACPDKDEWVLGARIWSGAIGLTDPSETDAVNSFGIACRSYPGRQLCL